jgi:hypothetical protein
VPEIGTITAEVVAYPNPFVENVNFKCWLPSGGSFEIQIYDVLGKQVLQHKEILEEGMHTIPLKINGMDYPAGVFTYQVKLNGKTQSSGKLVRM